MVYKQKGKPTNRGRQRDPTRGQIVYGEKDWYQIYFGRDAIAIEKHPRGKPRIYRFMVDLTPLEKPERLYLTRNPKGAEYK